jgi:iron complex outermembrane receptor protein
MSKIKLQNAGSVRATVRPIAGPEGRTRSSLLLLTGLTLAGLSSSALAQSSDLEVLETFTAVGQGDSRANNSLNLETLELVLPGVSPEKMLDRIPGVNVVSRDPFGFYEFGNDIRVRAFSIANLGVTLDGVPNGNSSARYGTPIGRLVSSENLTEIKVSQGAGDVTTPAYQALGGSLQYFTKTPTKLAGGDVHATVGSFDNINLFAKYEMGEIAPGFTGWVSGSHFEFAPRGLVGLAKGKARRIESALRYELPSGKTSVQFGLTYNDRDDYDTAGLDWQEWQDLEAGNYRGTGQGYVEYTPWDYPGIGTFNYADLTDQGRNLGPPAYLDPSVGPGEGTNSQFYDKWRNGRMDYLYRLNVEHKMDEGKTLSFIPYYQSKENYGLFGRDQSYAQNQIRAAYEGNPARTDIWGKLYYDVAGNPLSDSGAIVDEYSSAHAIVAPSVTAGGAFVPGVPGRTARDENFGGHRYGATLNYEWATERHKVIVGGWYEYDYHSTERPNFNLAGGSVLGEYLYDQFNFLNYSRYIDQDVRQLWVQDTVTLMNGKLELIGGIKAIELDRDARGFLTIGEWISDNETQRSTSYKDYFLPQVGLLYALTDSTEVFFNYSENMAIPDSGTITTAGATFNPDVLAPEYSDNIDIGIRGNLGDAGNYSFQAYYIKYVDRILASAVPIDSPNAGAAGNSVYQNVGGVDSWGIEAAVDMDTKIDGLRILGSIALQETTFQEDLFVGFSSTATVPTGFSTEPNPLTTGALNAFLRYEDISGNDLGNTPFMTANIDAIYRVGNWRLNLGGKFFDTVHVNTINTQPLPSYTVFEGGVAYSGKAGTKLEGWTASLSVYNLFDQYFWLARSYNDSNGQVLADRGRQFSFTIKTKF